MLKGSTDNSDKMSDTEIQELEDKIEALAQRIRSLEVRKRRVKQEGQIEKLSLKIRTLNIAKKKNENKLARARDHERANNYFSEMSNLEALQDLCANLCHERPSSVNKCKNLLATIYINIFDYVEGNYEYKYNSKQKLLRRCRKKGFFSREKAKSEGLRGLLKYLFR